MAANDRDAAGDRAARMAQALRDNLRRRKAQQRARDDLSGRDPNRGDTPLKRADLGESCDGAAEAEHLQGGQRGRPAK